MAEPHILTCLKVVPKPEEIRVDPQSHWLIRENVRSEINPPDMNALELALHLKDRHHGRLSLLSMGPPLFDHYLRIALAMGADQAFLLSDRAFGGADTLATTYTLAQAVQKIGTVDLILCGEESSDGATGHVPPGLAEWLGFNLITLVTHLDLLWSEHLVRGRRQIPGGYEILEVPLPAVISVKTAANQPRFIDYRLKERAFQHGPVTVWSQAELGADPSLIGTSGSPTIVSGLAQAPPAERKGIFLSGSAQEIAAQLASILRNHLDLPASK